MPPSTRRRQRGRATEVPGTSTTVGRRAARVLAEVRAVAFEERSALIRWRARSTNARTWPRARWQLCLAGPHHPRIARLHALARPLLVVAAAPEIAAHAAVSVAWTDRRVRRRRGVDGPVAALAGSVGVLLGHCRVSVLTFLVRTARISLMGERGWARWETASTVAAVVARVVRRDDIRSRVEASAIGFEHIACAPDRPKRRKHHDPHGESMGDVRADDNVETYPSSS